MALLGSHEDSRRVLSALYIVDFEVTAEIQAIPPLCLPGPEALLLKLESRRGRANGSAIPGIKNIWTINELFQEPFGLPLNFETSLFTWLMPERANVNEVVVIY